MATKERLTWSELNQGVECAEKAYGMKKHQIMPEIRRHTAGMNREQEREFVEKFYDRSKK